LRLEEIAYYQSQLQSIYQLNRVEYLASSNLYWDGKQKKLRSTVLLDKDLCPIEITPKKAGAGRISLRVAIFKQAVRSGDKPESRSQEKNRTVKEGGLEDRKDLAALLDTEIVVGLDDSVVLGFPSEGKKYFLTLRISRHTLSSPYGMRPLPKIKEFNVLQSPKPVRQVTPQYPEPCKEQGIEGVVVLQVTIDKSGGVTNLKVLKDVHPLLDKAAVEALQQWIFEPVLLNKKPVSVFFNVTVNFRLPIR
jgi:TonB family protein